MANKPTVEEMRQMVKEADKAASEAGLDQLNALVGSDQWVKVKTETETLRAAFSHDPLSKLQLDGLANLMRAVEALPAQISQRIAAQ